MSSCLIHIAWRPPLGLVGFVARTRWTMVNAD
jgi:hypothetical protein